MDDRAFPLIEQITDAGDHRERAARLLRLPDWIYVTHAAPLQKALLEAGFAAGAQFVHLREVAALRVRDPDGLLPVPVAQELENWRRALVKYAAGESLAADQ